jgi:hypothetical protein
MTVEQWDGAREEIPEELDEIEPQNCQRLGNPNTEWPFVTGVAKAVVGLRLIRHGKAMDLAVYEDWVPTDRLTTGGAIYFNPKINVRPLEVLTATHPDGSHSRVNIPLGFGTMKQRSQRAAVKPSEKQTAYDRLVSDHDMFDDD